MVNQPNAATSDATTTTISLPFQAAASGIWTTSTRFVDNGTGSAKSGIAVIIAGGVVIDFYTDWNYAVWTASGNKRIVHCVITYEIA